MILGSKRNNYSNLEYSLVMDRTEYEQALAGKPVYHVTASKDVAGEWVVSFKKFSKAKRKRMNLC